MPGLGLSIGSLVDAVIPMIGAGLSQKLKDMLMERKFMVELYSSLKEWTGLVAGAAISILYELARKRFQLPRVVDMAVAGVAADLGAETFATLMGAPFAFIDKDGRPYLKNIEGTTVKVFIDGTELDYDTTNGTWSKGASMSEGVHDIVFVGARKGRYVHQWTPAISA